MRVFTIIKCEDCDILVTGMSDYKRYHNGMWASGHTGKEREVSKEFAVVAEDAYQEYIRGE